MEKEVVGEIVLAKYHDKISNQDILEALKKTDLKESSLDIQLNDVCLMTDGNLVACNENSIMILGKVFLIIFYEYVLLINREFALCVFDVKKIQIL